MSKVSRHKDRKWFIDACVAQNNKITNSADSKIPWDREHLTRRMKFVSCRDINKIKKTITAADVCWPIRLIVRFTVDGLKSDLQNTGTRLKLSPVVTV